MHCAVNISIMASISSFLACNLCSFAFNAAFYDLFDVKSLLFDVQAKVKISYNNFVATFTALSSLIAIYFNEAS